MFLRFKFFLNVFILILNFNFNGECGGIKKTSVTVTFVTFDIIINQLENMEKLFKKIKIKK